MSKKSRAAQLIECGIEHDYTPNRIATLLHKMGGSMSRWEVIKVHGVWHAHEYGRNLYNYFSTWAKAMEYAAREAQKSPNTITIKDPSGAFCALTATVNERNHIHLNSDDDSFTLAPHEWRPLAGFLLAAADRAEEA